ncbi:MAG TPA: sigma-70 family RNA polymerase sigma factor [Hellea balneolensis]|uniref:Sigma-70 family RNA polymerase sigma factor n=1 Tax=Hellea balneolensis TaxID=287478 RepID=A0A7C3FZ01_9PROT|nr:sigma-70 family RNA polymerase sigma factor [Hellea balneolensis]
MKTDTNEERQEMLDVLPHIQRFAVSLTRNRADADDLLQTTVERVLVKGTPDGVNMKKWMFRICKNIWIDEIRSRKVRERAVESGDITLHDRPDWETEIMGRLKLKQVKDAMETLSDDQRLVLSLVAIEGFSYREAADVLELPVGTVMSRLARARRNLADMFAPDSGSTPFSSHDAFRA